METQTTNGHAKRKTPAKKAVRKADHMVRSAGRFVSKAERVATSAVEEGQRATTTALPKTGNFITRNPKTTAGVLAGVAIGTGLVVGGIVNRKVVRAAVLGAIALIAKRYF